MTIELLAGKIDLLAAQISAMWTMLSVILASTGVLGGIQLAMWTFFQVRLHAIEDRLTVIERKVKEE